MMTRTSLQPLHDPSKSSADGLGRAIGISVAAHLAVVAAFVVRMVVFPSEPMTLENAIRVDIVALPDKSPKLSSVPIVETKIPPPSPPPPDPAPAPAEEAKVPRPKPDSAKIDLNKTKTAQDSALKRLEALEKLERMTKSQPRQAAAPQPVKGNEVSRGGSLSGVIRLEQQGYLESVHGSVQSRWNLPGFLANANLKARVRLFIDGRGNVTRREITQSSRNDIFDARLLAAIDASSPLPVPPNSLVGILENDGIELGFEP